jgi:hypothetical protein
LKTESHAELFLRARIMLRALDLASAVTTHLNAVRPASRQAGSPLGRSTYCFKYASLPDDSARLSHLATTRFRDEPS